MASGTESRSASRAPKWVVTLEKVSSRLNVLAAIVAAVLLVLMTGHILLEIGLRFFSLSTFMADALVGHGVAAITFLAMAWALEKGTMIRVIVLTQNMPLRMRAFCEAFAIVSSMAMIGLLIRFEWRILARDFVRGTTTQHYMPIPLWIPESIFLLGLALLAFQFIVRLMRLLTAGFGEEERLAL